MVTHPVLRWLSTAVAAPLSGVSSGLIPMLPRIGSKSRVHTEHLAPCKCWEVPLETGKRAFNPSIVRYRDRILMAYTFADGWTDHQVRMAELDEQLHVTNYRDVDLSAFGVKHTEDMRLFVHQGVLHGLYFEGLIGKSESGIVLVTFDDRLNVVSRFEPRHGEKVRGNEKNWQFFSHGGELLCAYQIQPHVILRKHPESMEHVATTEGRVAWRRGVPGGGTPPIEFEGEYLSFFHSHTDWPEKPRKWPNRIYHAGAYTFDRRPPFKVRRMTSRPLMTASTHDVDPRWPAVVFPCGAIWHQDKVVVSYGYHDQRPKLAVYDAETLSARLSTVK